MGHPTFQSRGTSVHLFGQPASMMLGCGSWFPGIQAAVSLPGPSPITSILLGSLHRFADLHATLVDHLKLSEIAAVPVAESFWRFYSNLFNVPKPKGGHFWSSGLKCLHGSPKFFKLVFMASLHRGNFLTSRMCTCMSPFLQHICGSFTLL